MQIEGETIIIVIPEEAVAFPAAERLRANIMKLAGESECNVVLDCKNLKRLDVTVAKVGNEILFPIDEKDTVDTMKYYLIRRKEHEKIMIITE